MDVLHAVLYGTEGVFLIQFGCWLQRRRDKRKSRYPYKWSCPSPNCSFRITSTHEHVITTLSRDHRRYHKDQEIFT